jgi:hypothetical protein
MPPVTLRPCGGVPHLRRWRPEGGQGLHLHVEGLASVQSPARCWLSGRIGCEGPAFQLQGPTMLVYLSVNVEKGSTT